MDLMQEEEEEMEAVSTSQRPSQEVSTASKRIDVISLGVAFVKEIHDKGLTSEEVRGILKLIEKLLKKENLI